MKELLVSLLVWISAETGLEYDGKSAPTLEFASQEALARLQYDGVLPETFDSKTHSFLGLFDHNQQKIYLLDSIKPKSVNGRSILVHELVHYLQYQNELDHKVECRQQLEELAYFTQETFLKKYWFRPGFTTNDVFFRSQCRDG